MLPVKIGALLGAIIPAGLGAFEIFRDWMRPELPNVAYCGMPVLGAWFLLLFGTPIGAGTGAAVGVIWSLIRDTVQNSGR
jgi:hypothetical protein